MSSIESARAGDLPNPEELIFNPDTAQLKAAYKLGRDSVLAHFESEAAKNTSLALTRAQFKTWVAHCGNHFIKDRERGAIEQILFAASIMAGDYAVGKVPTPPPYNEHSPINGQGLSYYRKGYKKGIAHFVEIAQEMGKTDKAYDGLIVWLIGIGEKRSGSEGYPFSEYKNTGHRDISVDCYNDGFEYAVRYFINEAENANACGLYYYDFSGWVKKVTKLTNRNELSGKAHHRRQRTDWCLFYKKLQEGAILLLPRFMLASEFKSTKAAKWSQGEGAYIIGYNDAVEHFKVQAECSVANNKGHHALAKWMVAISEKQSAKEAYDNREVGANEGNWPLRQFYELGYASAIEHFLCECPHGREALPVPPCFDFSKWVDDVSDMGNPNKHADFDFVLSHKVMAQAIEATGFKASDFNGIRFGLRNGSGGVG